MVMINFEDYFEDQNDPVTPISYLVLVSIFLAHYENLFEPDSVFYYINHNCLLDMGDECSEEIQRGGHRFSFIGELLMQRTYKFREAEGRQGRIEVSFHKGMLVDARLQLNFHGFFAERKALKYISNNLRPVISGCLGEDNYQYDSSTYTCYNETALRDYKVAYQKETIYPNVITWITHMSFYI